MYRLYGALAVLALVVLISLAGFFVNTAASDRIIDCLDASLELAKNGEREKSEIAIAEARSLLNSRIEIMFLFVSHRKLDEIEQCIDKAEAYIGNNDMTSYYVYCSSAVELIRDYKSTEYPTIYNIL